MLWRPSEALALPRRPGTLAPAGALEKCRVLGHVDSWGQPWALNPVPLRNR